MTTSEALESERMRAVALLSDFTEIEECTCEGGKCLVCQAKQTIAEIDRLEKMEASESHD
jgi:hypothetical protein